MIYPAASSGTSDDLATQQCAICALAVGCLGSARKQHAALCELRCQLQLEDVHGQLHCYFYEFRFAARYTIQEARGISSTRVQLAVYCLVCPAEIVKSSCRGIRLHLLPLMLFQP